MTGATAESIFAVGVSYQTAAAAPADPTCNCGAVAGLEDCGFAACSSSVMQQQYKECWSCWVGVHPVPSVFDFVVGITWKHVGPAADLALSISLFSVQQRLLLLMLAVAEQLVRRSHPDLISLCPGSSCTHPPLLTHPGSAARACQGMQQPCLWKLILQP